MEQVEIWRPPALAGVELMKVQDTTRCWRVFHQSFTVVALEAGATEWQYRGRVQVATPGTTMLMEPGETHVDLRIPAPAGSSVVVLDPATLRRAALELTGKDDVHLRALQVHDPRLFAAARALASRDGPGPGRLAQDSRLAELVTRLLGHAETTPPRGSAGQQHAVARRARDVIEARFADDLSLEELAAEAGVSRFQLIRIFNKVLGLPPHAYQIQVRIARARALLAAGKPAVEVAARTGFADQAHLIRHFKRSLGATPGVYARAR